jgi:hypothetical protein
VNAVTNFGYHEMLASYRVSVQVAPCSGWGGSCPRSQYRGVGTTDASSSDCKQSE